jgi:hypothetical protein
VKIQVSPLLSCQLMRVPYDLEMQIADFTTATYNLGFISRLNSIL